MNSTSTHKTLLLHFIFFLFLGVILWAIAIVGQSNFPGDNFLPFLIRFAIQLALLILCYYINYKFCLKNVLDNDFLEFRPKSIVKYLSGSLLAALLIAAIWAVVYLFYPFKILKHSNSVFTNEITTYTLGNTLEELLFRGFLLVASIKLFGKIIGILLVSLLFGLFHLQGTGLTKEGLSMVMTTFTMSLLFISVIFFTKSIWAAVVLHITGNFLLHTLGFDGAGKGLFLIKFIGADPNGYLMSLIFEIVTIAFALLIFAKAKAW